MIAWTTSFSIAVGIYWRYLEPRGAPAVVAARDYGPVLQVASIALSLLLVFRTNSSYSRWQEGRQLTGVVLNCCRNLARVALACVVAPPGAEKSRSQQNALDAILRFSAALSPAAASFLQDDPGMLRYLCRGVLLDEELEFVERASAPVAPPPPPLPPTLAQAQRLGRRPSGEGGSGGLGAPRRPSSDCGGGRGAGGGAGSRRQSLESAWPPPSSPFARPTPPLLPNAPNPAAAPAPIVVAQVLSALVARAGLDSVDRQACEALLSGFDVALGGCQRLAGSPIPAAYTRHTSRFLIAYLMLLPIALFPSLNWLTVAVVVTLTFFLAGIENVGVQIENPMRVLPLRSLARSYRDAVLAMARVSGPCAEVADGIVAGVGGGGATRRSPFL